MRSELTPTDADFDNMHHALGRPDGEWVAPYRNYFSCEAEGPDARRFRELGSYWSRGVPINDGCDAVFQVTPEGQRQVMAWLELRRRASGRRPWRVTGGGITPRIVVAKSAAAAKHSVYLEVSDTGFWPNYRAFVTSGIQARVA